MFVANKKRLKKFILVTFAGLMMCIHQSLAMASGGEENQSPDDGSYVFSEKEMLMLDDIKISLIETLSIMYKKLPYDIDIAKSLKAAKPVILRSLVKMSDFHGDIVVDNVNIDFVKKLGLTMNLYGHKLKVGKISPQSVASKIGLRENDTIKRVDINKNGKKQHIDFSEPSAVLDCNMFIMYYFEMLMNAEAKFTIDRNGEQLLIVMPQQTTGELTITDHVNYIDVSDDIMMISISSLDGSDVLALEKELLSYANKKNNIKGYIFDLRGNSGGLISSAISILQYFSGDGKLLMSVRNDKNQIVAENYFTLKANSKMLPIKDKPIVVIVDQNTASAAEALAYFFKYHFDAVIIGQQTYGKYSSQDLYDLQLSQGFSLLTTNMMYYVGDGNVSLKGGIVPDAEASDIDNQLYIKELAKNKILTKLIA